MSLISGPTAAERQVMGAALGATGITQAQWDSVIGQPIGSWGESELSSCEKLLENTGNQFSKTWENEKALRAEWKEQTGKRSFDPGIGPKTPEEGAMFGRHEANLRKMEGLADARSVLSQKVRNTITGASYAKADQPDSGFREMASKYPGKCAVTGKSFPVGTKIRWKREAGAVTDEGIKHAKSLESKVDRLRAKLKSTGHVQ